MILGATSSGGSTAKTTTPTPSTTTKKTTTTTAKKKAPAAAVKAATAEKKVEAAAPVIAAQEAKKVVASAPNVREGRATGQIIDDSPIKKKNRQQEFLESQQFSAGDSDATKAAKAAAMVAGEVTGANSIARLTGGTYDVTHGSLLHRLEAAGGAALDVANLALTYTPIVGEAYMGAKAVAVGGKAAIALRAAEAAEAGARARNVVKAGTTAARDVTAARELGVSMGTSRVGAAAQAIKTERATQKSAKALSTKLEDAANMSARSGEKAVGGIETSPVIRAAEAATGEAARYGAIADKAANKALAKDQALQDKLLFGKRLGKEDKTFVHDSPSGSPEKIAEPLRPYTAPESSGRMAKPIFEKPLPTDPVVPNIIKIGEQESRWLPDAAPQMIKDINQIEKDMQAERARELAPKPALRIRGGRGPAGTPGGVRGGVRGGEPGGRPGGRFGPDNGPGGSRQFSRVGGREGAAGREGYGPAGGEPPSGGGRREPALKPAPTGPMVGDAIRTGEETVTRLGIDTSLPGLSLATQVLPHLAPTPVKKTAPIVTPHPTPSPQAGIAPTPSTGMSTGTEPHYATQYETSSPTGTGTGTDIFETKGGTSSPPPPDGGGGNPPQDQLKLGSGQEDVYLKRMA